MQFILEDGLSSCFVTFLDDFSYSNQTSTQFRGTSEIDLMSTKFIHLSNVFLLFPRSCTEEIQAFILIQPLNIRNGPIHAKSGFGLSGETINKVMRFSFCCMLLALETHPGMQLNACLLGKCD